MTTIKGKSLKDLMAEIGLDPSFHCNVELGLEESILSEEDDDRRLVEAIHFKSLNPNINLEDPDSPRSFKLEIHLSYFPGAPAMGISFNEVARDVFEPDDAFATAIDGTRQNMVWRPILEVPAIDNLATMIVQHLKIGGPLIEINARSTQTAALFKRKPS